MTVEVIGQRWSVRVNNKGYYRINSGTHRGKYLHRVVWETVAGKALAKGFCVAHQDHQKLHCCPQNLIACPLDFNPSPARRCPWTGKFLTAEEAKRIYRSEEVPF